MLVIKGLFKMKLYRPKIENKSKYLVLSNRLNFLSRKNKRPKNNIILKVLFIYTKISNINFKSVENLK